MVDPSDFDLMNKRLHLYYSGSVHGVGFRFTAERTALSLGLTGWVKNLNDGRVEIICEGTAKAIDEFRSKIQAVFGEYIIKTEAIVEEPSGEFTGFDIRS